MGQHWLMPRHSPCPRNVGLPMATYNYSNRKTKSLILLHRRLWAADRPLLTATHRCWLHQQQTSILVRRRCLRIKCIMTQNVINCLTIIMQPIYSPRLHTWVCHRRSRCARHIQLHQGAKLTKRCCTLQPQQTTLPNNKAIDRSWSVQCVS